MPELPEVETIRKELAKFVVGKKIKQVEILHPSAIKSNVKTFTASLEKKHIRKVGRVGKLLIFTISGGEFLLIHLKMTGQLIYRHKDFIIKGGHSLSRPKEIPDKYIWVAWHFTDGSNLYFNDMRKFGYVKIVDAAEKERIMAAYGPEPLTKDFTLKKFFDTLDGRNAPIKSILLNQALIAGIGNIYADEACFAAKIFPGTRASKLRKAEKIRLFKAINAVLKKAIKYKGTTFHSFVSARGKRGNFWDFLQVYKRDKKPCLRCATGIIANKTIAGRNSRYCPVCQKMIQ